jgi:chromosome segregation ATPase
VDRLIQSAVGGFKEEMKRLRIKNDELSANVLQKQAKIDQHALEIQMAKMEQDLFKNQASELTAANKKLKSKVHMLKAKYEEVKIELNRAESLLDDTLRDLEQTRERLSRIQLSHEE